MAANHVFCEAAAARRFLMALCAAALTTASFAADSAALASDRLALADLLASRGMLERAIGEYKALIENPDAPKAEVLYRLGEAFRRQGKSAEAREAYDRVLAEFPLSAVAGRARFGKALMLDNAQAEREFAAIAASGDSPALVAAARYRLALAIEKAGRIDEALAAYESLAAEHPGDIHVPYAKIRKAAILSARADLPSHRQALGIYLELAASKDKAVAEEALRLAARQSFSDARYEEAATLFGRLAERFPASPRAGEARVDAAWALHLYGRNHEALAELEKAGAAADGEEALFLKGAALVALERRGDALAAYDALLAAFPAGGRAAEAWLEKLRILFAAGRHKAVLAELAAKSAPDPSVADRARWLGGEAARAEGNIPLAREYYHLAAKDDNGPCAKEAAYTLGWLAASEGNHLEASRLYREVARRWPADPDSARALYAAGDSALKAGDRAAALADWTKLLGDFPDSGSAPDALYRRAVEEVRAGEHRSARNSFDEFLRRFANDRRRAEALYFSAFASERLGENVEAERRWRESLAADPAPEFRRECLLALGTLFTKTGRDGEAVKLFSELVSTDAVDRLAADRLAWTAEALIAAGMNDDALKAAEALRKRNLDALWNQTAETECALARLAKGERDAALAAFRRALAFDARTVWGAQAALEAGRLETAAGRYDEAKELLADAVRRSAADELLANRLQAYAALAANEEARGKPDAALEYHMIVGTLFDDPKLTPKALERSEAILRAAGRTAEADEIAAELARRYPPSQKGGAGK